MIPYEELVAALDRYVARNGGTPQSARMPAGVPQSTPAHDEPPAHEVSLAYDEHHDPDRHGIAGHGGDEDATHVGASPAAGALPPPLSPVADESNEIDIGDVLADEDL
jgi:hypothetical protein